MLMGWRSARRGGRRCYGIAIARAPTAHMCSLLFLLKTFALTHANTAHHTHVKQYCHKHHNNLHHPRTALQTTKRPNLKQPQFKHFKATQQLAHPNTQQESNAKVSDTDPSDAFGSCTSPLPFLERSTQPVARQHRTQQKHHRRVMGSIVKSLTTLSINHALAKVGNVPPTPPHQMSVSVAV